MTRPILLPAPRQITMTGGTFSFAENDCLLVRDQDKEELYVSAVRLKACVRESAKVALPLMIERQGKKRAAVAFERDTTLPVEAYQLEIRQEGILVRSQGGPGAFHAVSTIKQLLLQYGNVLPCVSIMDSPDYKARGIMLDISRDKIPTQASLFRIVDLMADLKMNQLQLYIEGFSFAYASYPWVWQTETPITGEDILELDRYCKERYIELVPNQNSFGHMNAWLSTREFRHLAEKPDGIEMDWDPGRISPPGTLNPDDPGSLELVRGMSADLLPYFSSGLFNVGCDETFELGRGRSKERCEAVGTGQVYLDYLLKIHELVKSHGKRMMFWGDIIHHHPELIGHLPQDIIALEWGYEGDHPFEEHGKAFQAAGIDFYVCPGTSSWVSLSGRTDNMKANLLSAAENGKRYGAVGYLITDWGDCGHWQYPFVSYPGFLYGAALSWSVEANRNADLAAGLNRFVFLDDQERMGDMVLNLGNYYLKEKKQYGNYTGIAYGYLRELDDLRTVEGYAPEHFAAVRDHALSLEGGLSQVRMRCEDAELVLEEFRNAVRFIVHGTRLGLLKLMMQEDRQSRDVESHLEAMTLELDVLIRKHENLWLRRNRHGGLNRSVKNLLKWKKTYLEMLGT